MYISRVKKSAFLNAVLIIISLSCRKSFPLETAQQNGRHPNDLAQRREHLRASLCASFYLQERGQRLPKNPEFRRELCGTSTSEPHGGAKGAILFGSMNRETFREARFTFSVSYWRVMETFPLPTSSPLLTFAWPLLQLSMEAKSYPAFVLLFPEYCRLTGRRSRKEGIQAHTCVEPRVPEDPAPKSTGCLAGS